MTKSNLDIASPLAMPSSDSCSRCGRPLMVTTVEVLGTSISLRATCECRYQELEAREKQARIEQLRQAIRSQGLEEGLYAHMTMRDWRLRNDSAKAAAKKLQNYLHSARLGGRNWLYLYGGYGLGKTHLAVAAVKELCLERHWQPQLIRWSQYCSRIQQSWHSPDGASEYELWCKATQVTLLVIDDMDKRGSSEWALGKLYELIDQRCTRQMPTITTANRSLAGLASYWERSEPMQDLAKAIISRILGQLLTVIEFSGDDYRFGGHR